MDAMKAYVITAIYNDRETTVIGVTLDEANANILAERYGYEIEEHELDEQMGIHFKGDRSCYHVEIYSDEAMTSYRSRFSLEKKNPDCHGSVGQPPRPYRARQWTGTSGGMCYSMGEIWASSEKEAIQMLRDRIQNEGENTIVQ